MMRKVNILLLLLLALPLLATSCSSQEQNNGFGNATLEQAHQAWLESQQQADKALFLDVRTAAEYAEGHVPDAFPGWKAKGYPVKQE